MRYTKLLDVRCAFDFEFIGPFRQLPRLLNVMQIYEYGILGHRYIYDLNGGGGIRGGGEWVGMI
jgi:hypothetical protein